MGNAIGWVGSSQAAELRALHEAGAHIKQYESLDQALEERTYLRGICVDMALREYSYRLTERSDGLATALGWTDTLAFAGGLPGAFGFSCRVGGLVQAIREASGCRYLDMPAVIVGGGSEASAAMAAFTQLKTSSLTVYLPPADTPTLAVAHKLGVTLSTEILQPRWEEQLALQVERNPQKDGVSKEDKSGEDKRGNADLTPVSHAFLAVTHFLSPERFSSAHSCLFMDARSGVWGLFDPENFRENSTDTRIRVLQELKRNTDLSFQYTAEAQIRLLA